MINRWNSIVSCHLTACNWQQSCYAFHVDCQLLSFWWLASAARVVILGYLWRHVRSHFMAQRVVCDKSLNHPTLHNLTLHSRQHQWTKLTLDQFHLVLISWFQFVDVVNAITAYWLVESSSALSKINTVPVPTLVTIITSASITRLHVIAVPRRLDMPRRDDRDQSISL